MTWRATSGRTIAASPGAGSTAAAIAATHPARRRICVVSDDLSGAPDEGVKKFTLALSGALRADHEVAVLSARGPVVPPGVAFVPAPRSFASPRLRAAIRRHDPALVIYAARSSATFFGFARAWLLGRYAPGARLVLLGL